MYALAKETSTIVEIAYDPKIFHTKDYIQALVSFETKKSTKLLIKWLLKKGVTVNIEFEYERIHKRCFHCLCLTHEKLKCPLLMKGPKILKESDPRLELMHISLSDKVESSQKNALTNGPPGFPQLFPELPPQEQMMNMLYVSHSDDAERHASIFLVKQSLADQGKLHVATLTRLTSDLDKGKGHVFSYTKNNSVEKLSKIPRAAQSLPIQTQFHSEDEKLDSAFSAMVGCSDSAVSTSFQVGTSLDPPACDRRVGKMSRCRPPSWKIKAQAVKAVPNRRNTAASSLTLKENGGKSKPDSLIHPRKLG
ncbi:uncharacterized protein LOC106448180 [Brassica napus]|nr:uncharacterized protein LOC106448180 [Brassica napus]